MVNPWVSNAFYKTENQKVSLMLPGASIQCTPYLKLEMREVELNLDFQEGIVIMTIQIISLVEGTFQSTEACWPACLVAWWTEAWFITVSPHQDRTALGRLWLVKNHKVRGGQSWSRVNQHCPSKPPVELKGCLCARIHTGGTSIFIDVARAYDMGLVMQDTGLSAIHSYSVILSAKLQLGLWV